MTVYECPYCPGLHKAAKDRSVEFDAKAKHGRACPKPEPSDIEPPTGPAKTGWE